MPRTRILTRAFYLGGTKMDLSFQPLQVPSGLLANHQPKDPGVYPKTELNNQHHLSNFRHLHKVLTKCLPRQCFTHKALTPLIWQIKNDQSLPIKLIGNQHAIKSFERFTCTNITPINNILSHVHNQIQNLRGLSDNSMLLLNFPQQDYQPNL